jgi:hypothetical protein
MSRARRDRDDWDVGAPPAPAYGDVPTIPDLSVKRPIGGQHQPSQK